MKAADKVAKPAAVRTKVPQHAVSATLGFNPDTVNLATRAPKKP